MLIFILALLFCPVANATMQIHNNPDEMDTIIRVDEQYVPEYQGQKDRYNLAKLQNDQEVYVAKAVHASMDIRGLDKERKTTAMRIKPKKVDDGIKVSSCVEWNGECKPSEEFKATVR